MSREKIEELNSAMTRNNIRGRIHVRVFVDIIDGDDTTMRVSRGSTFYGAGQGGKTASNQCTENLVNSTLDDAIKWASEP